MSSYSKAGICVGINEYPNPANNLKGCVPDAKLLREVLLSKYKFDNIDLFTDKNATYKNVVRSIENCMMNMKDYGHFVFTVSSHGTTVPDLSGDEEDGRDEAICLYDRLLVDDTFRKLLDHAPVGLRMTIITDCCHSGSITRSTYVNRFGNFSRSETYMKPRYLPPEDDNFALKSNTVPIKSKMFTPEKDMREVLITGCKSNEYSYDALYGKSYNGALTYNLVEILKSNTNLTYYQLYKLLQQKLPSSQYPQTPQLEGSDENKKRIIFS
jgi:hypothetical protein